MTVKGAGAAARQRRAPQHGGAHAPACALRCPRPGLRAALPAVGHTLRAVRRRRRSGLT